MPCNRPSSPPSLPHVQLEATSLSEREDLARCRARLQHLRDLGEPDKDAQARRLTGRAVTGTLCLWARSGDHC